jgi:hypothetical protein
MLVRSFWETTAAALRRISIPILIGLSAFLPPTLGWAQTLHGLGALPPKQTIPVSASALAGAAAVPPTSVDLSQWTVPVGDQGQINSCVSWAIAYDMLGWYTNYLNMGQTIFAPMYMYSQINNGRPSSDKGAYPADGFNLALKQGVDRASDYSQAVISSYGSWPYAPFYDWKTLPTAAQQANAAYHVIGSWKPLFSYPSGNAGAVGQNAIQSALANGQPVAVLFRDRTGFDNLTATNYIDTDTTGASRGNHEVLAVGYDQNGLLIQNSWGTDWGNAGFGWLSWNVVQKDIFEAEVIDQAFLIVYTVTSNADTGGTISPSGNVAVVSGKTKAFTVTPNSHYSISSVVGTCGGKLNSNTYTTQAIAADCTVTATFAVTTYTVTSSVSGTGGTISPLGGTSVAWGMTKTFTLTPGIGYVASSVGGTCGGTLSGNTYTTKAITANCTVIAKFAQGTYSVTSSVSGTGGTITPATASVKGTATTSFTLKPSAGYVSSAVGGTCGGTLSGNTFKTTPITANCTVIAAFVPGTYTVTPSVSGSGGSIGPATATSVKGTVTTAFTLTPIAGYVASSVSGTCGGTLSGNTYTTKAITANCTVIAKFAQGTYSMTSSVSGTGGTITPATASVKGTATTSLTLKPSAGYVSSSVGGTCGGTLNGNTFKTTPITANCTVIATFTPAT